MKSLNLPPELAALLGGALTPLSIVVVNQKTGETASLGGPARASLADAIFGKSGPTSRDNSPAAIAAKRAEYAAKEAKSAQQVETMKRLGAIIQGIMGDLTVKQAREDAEAMAAAKDTLAKIEETLRRPLHDDERISDLLQEAIDKLDDHLRRRKLGNAAYIAAMERGDDFGIWAAEALKASHFDQRVRNLHPTARKSVEEISAMTGVAFTEADFVPTFVDRVVKAVLARRAEAERIAAAGTVAGVDIDGLDSETRELLRMAEELKAAYGDELVSGQKGADAAFMTMIAMVADIPLTPGMKVADLVDAITDNLLDQHPTNALTNEAADIIAKRAPDLTGKDVPLAVRERVAALSGAFIADDTRHPELAKMLAEALGAEPHDEDVVENYLAGFIPDDEGAPANPLASVMADRLKEVGVAGMGNLWKRRREDYAIGTVVLHRGGVWAAMMTVNGKLEPGTAKAGSLWLQFDPPGLTPNCTCAACRLAVKIAHALSANA